MESELDTRGEAGKLGSWWPFSPKIFVLVFGAASADFVIVTGGWKGSARPAGKLGLHDENKRDLAAEKRFLDEKGEEKWDKK